MSERKKILDMLAADKIRPEEAEKLLSAIKPKSNKSKLKKKLHIQVMEEDSEKPKVNIAIPLSLAKIGMKLIPKNADFKAKLSHSNFDFSSINWKEILELAGSGEEGDLFFMEVNEDDGSTTTIRIFVE